MKNSEINDKYLIEKGFRAFQNNQRFHRKNLLLKKDNGSYKLVGYDSCKVDTIERLAMLFRLIENEELT